MENRPNPHPSARALQSFGLGKLDEAAAQAVLSHLSDCPDCRAKVTSQSGDNFLKRIRAVHDDASGTPVPAKPLPGRATHETGSEASPPSPVPGLPKELADNPNYQVLRELGRGGMGVVYLARDTMMDRKVVLKVMGAAYLERPEIHDRFVGEIRSAGRLDHPNVVKAYASLQLGDLIVFVMEYVDGEDLHRLVKNRGPLPVANACYYAYQVALGLQHAHEKGMVHRDIKPHNLMLARGKKHQIKILDFGLAKATSEKEQDCGLTGEGQMLGTPDYVAPEQTMDAATATIRSDIYSLGCTLHYLLTGKPPFTGTSVAQVLLKHQMAEPQPLEESRSETPAGVAAVVRRMMAKDPAERYQTPAEVAQALLPFIKAKAMPVTASQTSARGPESADVWRALSESVAPLPAAKPATKRRWASRVGVMVAVLLAGLAATVLAGVLAFWETPQGIVKIESDDPSVEIVFDATGPTIKGAGKEPIRLKPGQHNVLIKRGDFEFETDKFVLKKGAVITLRVELLQDKIQLSADGQVIGAKAMPAPAVASPRPAEPLPTTFTNNIGMEFVLVPKGKSWLGGGAGRPGSTAVLIPDDFYLGKFEVTQEEWEKVTGFTPSHFSRTGDGKNRVKDIADADLKRFPVENVAWDDVQKFLEQMNKSETIAGWVYRLPKEMEWEYACRGGPIADQSDYAFDYYLDKPTNQLLPEQANFKHDKGLTRPCKVGSYRPNRLGLYDMHGNITEWCDDAENHAEVVPRRVNRGGGWNYGSIGCRAATREAVHPPWARFPTHGLRVARFPLNKEAAKPSPEGTDRRAAG